MLEPLPAPREPQLISDGGGLPFSPAALAGPPGPLDSQDPAVAALIVQIAKQPSAKAGSRLPWKQSGAAPASPASSAVAPAAPLPAVPAPAVPAPAVPAPAVPVPVADGFTPGAPNLAGWRILARSDDDVLFARGRPPQLLTVAVRRDPKRGKWACVGVSAARPLRAARDRIRASGWRPDPTREVKPEDSLLRVLVAEQTFAGGKRADARLLAPDLYIGEQELVLTMFVTPLPGFQTRSLNPETPARIALPQPVGPRRLIDGARYELAQPA